MTRRGTTLLTEEPSSLRVRCTRCGTEFEGNFCPSCGYPAAGRPPAPPGPLSAFLGVLWTLAIVLFLVYLAAILVATFLVAPGVVGGIQEGACEDCVGFLFFVSPFPLQFFFILLEGVGFLVWFLVLMGLLAGLFAYMALFHGRSLETSLRLPLTKVGEKAASRSTLVALGQVFMAVLFFDVVYFVLILPALGIQAEAPPGFQELPNWYLMYSLVEAAFTEEVATRVALIGLPLAVGSLAVRLYQASQGPRRAGYVLASLKHLAGGQVRGSSPPMTRTAGAVLLILSAAFFGFLHVFSGWAPWKFVDTFVGGLALGYLFLRRGVVASILLHFSINGFTVLVNAAGGEETLLSLAFVIVFYLGLAALGSGFFVYYLRRVGRLLLRPPASAPPRVATAAAPPPGMRAPPRQEMAFPVACPQCGAQEAVYEEGALRCAVCGSPL